MYVKMAVQRELRGHYFIYNIISDYFVNVANA